MMVGAFAAPAIARRISFGAMIALGPLGGLAAAAVMLSTIWVPSGILAAVSFFLFGAGPVLWSIATLTRHAECHAWPGFRLHHHGHVRSAADRCSAGGRRRHALRRRAMPGGRRRGFPDPVSRHHSLSRTAVARVAGSSLTLVDREQSQPSARQNRRNAWLETVRSEPMVVMRRQHIEAFSSKSPPKIGIRGGCGRPSSLTDGKP